MLRQLGVVRLHFYKVCLSRERDCGVGFDKQVGQVAFILLPIELEQPRFQTLRGYMIGA